MSESIKVVRNLRDLRKATSKWRQRGESIALVPTMGALHAGHLALVKLAKKKADKAVVSIFVNPTQFGPKEDLSRYPRDEAGDLAKLTAVHADLVWAPSVEEMYPDGFSASVRAGSAAKELEGEFRPFHFDGVATVCTKLFNQVTPDIAIFGEKDYQQLAVLRQVVRDLDIPLKLIGGPTKRDKDGLALSSRNAYLSEDERKIAPTLHAVISALAKDVANGADVRSGVTKAKRKLTAAGFQKIDYLEVRDAQTLAQPDNEADGRDLRVLAAVWLGKTRLIDNVAV
ncbi:pantoate--beta-alanine ligase [Hyphomicrobium sp.]|uniref:pantoate--beta-alanine ligase n=1 Tax=Hyphomicrobium sp. TaxID=82 RepID=UPI002D78E93D|nr:pantoate--beta-alanine ligase [Hyphomicrobium sp.]HET6389973.1 pantoate--beta-alanine ligase [Hyphomicrobium sp.]